jgi:hypothetical protein
MNQADKDLGYQILDVLLEAMEGRPLVMDVHSRLDNSPRPPGMSLSSAGKGTRQLAWMSRGVPGKPASARYMTTMDMGSLAHDYLRQAINNHEECSFTDEERTVNLQVGDGTVSGHIDGFFLFKDLKILLDIKCVNLYTFNDLDPRNPETNWWARAKKWNAGNYVFDAIPTFSGDIFKNDYIAQIACYEQALADEGESWDATAFLLYCRDTGHIAVGIFNPDEAAQDKIVEDSRRKMQKVLDNDDPFVYDTCWEAAVGAEPHKVCQYCRYRDECFEIKTTVFRGKPRHQIKRIKDG